MNTVIAIDGPAASGKSTVARRVAEARGSLYVDSGALYRAMAWRVIESDIDPMDAECVTALLPSLDMEIFVDGPEVGFRMGGEVPGLALRTERVNQAVSPVAANPAVRAYVTARLRDMLTLGHLVMEGRDIGTVVFPQAEYKFYLDADPEVRAHRRHAEMVEKEVTVDAVGTSLIRRDQFDSARTTAPLTVASDAVVVDSSRMNIAEVTAFVLQAVARLK